MDIREALLFEHSKQQTLKIVNYIGDSQDLFDEVIELFLNDKYRVNQRAAWVLSHVADVRPYLIQPHLEKIIKNLDNPVHDAVKRNTLRIIPMLDVPEELQGFLVDRCFRFLLDPQEAIAIHAHSMEIIFQIGKKETDLFYELRAIIEDQLPYGSAGYKSKGKKILKYINKTLKD